MSPREAPQVDPAQRLSLLTAYEAIEKAGLVPDATPSTQRDRVGVFYGTTSNDWGETNQRFQQSVLRPVAVLYYGLRKRAVRSEGVSCTVVVA